MGYFLHIYRKGIPPGLVRGEYPFYLYRVNGSIPRQWDIPSIHIGRVFLLARGMWNNLPICIEATGQSTSVGYSIYTDRKGIPPGLGQGKYPSYLYRGNGSIPRQWDISSIHIGRVFPLTWDRGNTLPICIEAVSQYHVSGKFPLYR